MNTLDSLRVRTAVDAIKIELDEVRQALHNTQELSNEVTAFRQEVKQWREAENEREQALLKLVSDQIAETVSAALQPITEALEQLKTENGGTKQTLTKTMREGFAANKKQSDQIKKSCATMQTRLEKAVTDESEKCQAAIKTAVNDLEFRLTKIETSFIQVTVEKQAEDDSMPSPLRAPAGKKRKLEAVVARNAVPGEPSSHTARLPTLSSATRVVKAQTKPIAEWAAAVSASEGLSNGAAAVVSQVQYRKAQTTDSSWQAEAIVPASPSQRYTQISQPTRTDNRPIKARRVILQDDDGLSEWPTLIPPA
ncbi:hypothetical protein ACM66B_001922 [Microbotryomycetes sp. NB124-2]